MPTSRTETLSTKPCSGFYSTDPQRTKARYTLVARANLEPPQPPFLANLVPTAMEEYENLLTGPSRPLKDEPWQLQRGTSSGLHGTRQLGAMAATELSYVRPVSLGV